jgi:hypothetical protein
MWDHLPHIDTNNTWILNNYGHEQPLTIPSVTVVGSGLRYSHKNGTRSLMPLYDAYLLQRGRSSHLPIISALPTVFGRQCIGDMIPLLVMEMIGEEVFREALSLSFLQQAPGAHPPATFGNRPTLPR